MMTAVPMGDNLHMLEATKYPLVTLVHHLNCKSVDPHDPKDYTFGWLDSTINGKTEPRWNYLQVFKNTIEVAANELHAVNYYKRKHTVELCRMIEKTFYYGNRNHVNNNYHTTGGIAFFSPTVEEVYPQNVSDFHEVMNTHVFGNRARYDLGQPWVFVPTDLWKMIREVGWKLPEDKTYGVACAQFYCLRGVAYIAPSSLLVDSIFAVSLDDLVYRYRKDKDITIYEDPFDRYVHAEVGLELHNPFKHLHIKLLKEEPHRDRMSLLRVKKCDSQ